MTTTTTAETTRTCAWCSITASAGTMEPINAGPSVACKDVHACQERISHDERMAEPFLSIADIARELSAGLPQKEKISANTARGWLSRYDDWPEADVTVGLTHPARGWRRTRLPEWRTWKASRAAGALAAAGRRRRLAVARNTDANGRWRCPAADCNRPFRSENERAGHVLGQHDLHQFIREYAALRRQIDDQLCVSCHTLNSEHCTMHSIPCCPGECDPPWGTVTDMDSGEPIRPATQAEWQKSAIALASDLGAFTDSDGKTVYVVDGPDPETFER